MDHRSKINRRDALSGLTFTTAALAASSAASSVNATEVSQTAIDAQGAADLAEGYASDVVSQGNVPIYSSRAGVAGLSIPVGIAAFRTNGYAVVGDGGDALYKKVGSQPSHAGKVQSADGAWWELVRGPIVDLRSFGAKGDWNGAVGTDSQQAFTDAIGFLGNEGGTIRIVGQFYKSSTHLIETNVVFRGDGSSGLNSRPSAVVVPAGKTAFIYQAGASTRSSGAGIDEIEIQAVSKNTNSTTGAIAVGSRTLTLASAGDFETGQVVCVRGAGLFRVGLSHVMGDPAYCSARTTAGSNVMVTSSAASASSAGADQKIGVVPGMRIDVAGAGFPAGTYCVSVDAAGNCLMSQQAANTVSGAAITFYDDLRAVITAGGGTTTLTLNCRAGGAVTDAAVEHYDCAVVGLTRLVTGRSWAAKGFSGAAFLIMGGAGILSSRGADANANCSVINYGNVSESATAVAFQGTDANAGAVNNVMISGSTRYAFIDNSLLGNAFSACHAAGVGGWMVPLRNPNTTIVACYVEAGVPCTLGEHTVSIGGTFAGVNPCKWGGETLGGTTAFGLAFSSARIGRTFGLNYTVGIARAGYAFSIDASRFGGSSNLQFKRSVVADGQAALWGWWSGTAPLSCSFFFGDVDAAFPGVGYMPNGYFIGRSLTSVAQANFRRRIGTSGAPTTGQATRGDIWEDFSASAGGNLFYVCTTSGIIGSTAVIKKAGAIGV